MPITYQWHIEQRVILVRLDGDINPDEVESYNDNLAKMVESGIKPIHILADTRCVKHINIRPHDAIFGSHYLLNNKVGYVVAIGTTGIVDFFIKLVSRVIPLKLHHAYTLDEAMSILRDKDSTLTRC